MNESEEQKCQFIEAGSNSAVLLHAVEKAFYKMIFLILVPIAFPWICGVRLRRYTLIGVPV